MVDYILEQLIFKEGLVPATVIRQLGSSLQGVGSKMAIIKSRRICGSVSAGCIESAVVQEACLVLERGITKIPHFSGQEDDFSINLSYGGKLDILLQPIQDGIGRVSGDIYLSIRDTLVQRKTVITAADIMGKASGRIRILDPNHADKNISLDADSASKWKDFLDKDQCGLVSMGERSFFIDFWKRKPRMVIVGAGHIAVALAETTKTLDY